MSLDPKQPLPPLECNGCTSCCRGDKIGLDPRVDDPRKYKTKIERGVRVLKQDSEGNCVYLGKKGCQIHFRAPSMCKAFDCRRYVLQVIRMPPEEQARRWKNPRVATTLRRGVELLHVAEIEIPWGEEINAECE